MSAFGGGDPPDAVADGLYDALNLNYRERATKICVWIGKYCRLLVPCGQNGKLFALVCCAHSFV